MTTTQTAPTIRNAGTKPINPQKETSALFAVSVDSRAEVDAVVEKAINAGASHAADPKDHGFMYQWSFYDLDGYHWEVFWMDPSAING